MTERLAAVPLIVAVGILIWNIVLAGWIATRRNAPRSFTMLTSLCGLLVAPAVLVAVATGTDAGARTVIGIAWLWPVITTGFALQVALAIGAGLVSPVVGVPFLLYDTVVAAVAVGDYFVSQQGSAPVWLQSAVAARDAIAGFSIGRTALVSPLSVLVPMIAPAFPARLRVSAAIRALLTLTATAVTTLLVVELPRGYGALVSYDDAIGARLQERTHGEFSIGIRLFPVLVGPPSARAVKADLALAEMVGAEAVLVVLRDDGTRPNALDSLARVLEPLRADSVTIAVALEIGSAAMASSSAAQTSELERVLRRLRPDVVFPAFLPAIPRLFAGPDPSVAWWRNLLLRSAATIARVQPKTRLGWAASRLNDNDSAVYNWAASPASPVKVLGAVSYPSFAGLPAVKARLRALERWHAAASARSGAQQPHWLVTVGGFPHAHGDAAQTAAVMQALSWGSRQPWINAAIVGEAGDYDGGLGLRAANGRVRPVADVVARAARGLRETSALGR